MNNCDLFEAENSSTFDQNDESFYEDGEAKKSALNMNSYSAIITKKNNQDVSSLLKFKLRKEDSGDSTTAAQIIAISFDDSKLNEVCRARVKGLVSPDLLLFQVCNLRMVCRNLVILKFCFKYYISSIIIII